MFSKLETSSWCDEGATSSNVPSSFLGCQWSQNEGCYMNIVHIYIPVWSVTFLTYQHKKALPEADSLWWPAFLTPLTRVMGRSETSDPPPARCFPNKENQWTQTSKQRVDLAAAEHVVFFLCFTHCAVRALQTSEQLFSDQPWREADWLLKSLIRGTFTS